MKNKKGTDEDMVDVGDLNYFEGNPKNATAKVFKKLLKSVKEIGIVEPLTVNTTTHTVLNGNQRMKCAMQLGIKQVKVRWVTYTKEEEAKILIHLNETLAEKNPESMKLLFAQYPDDEFIQSLASEYATAVEKLNQMSSGQFEVVKEVDESYDYIVFITKKRLDQLNVETFFNLGKVYDQHRQKVIGQGRVVDGVKLTRLIEFAVSHGLKNIDEL